MGKKEEEKTDKKPDPPSFIRSLFKYITLCVTLLVVGLACFQYYQIFTGTKKVTVRTFYLATEPFFLILFSFALFFVELGVKFFRNAFPFLGRYIGIGLYYIFLATNLGSPIKDPSEGEEIVYSILSWVLFALGMIYTFLFWCVNDTETEEDRQLKALEAKKKAERKEKQKQLLDDQQRQSETYGNPIQDVENQNENNNLLEENKDTTINKPESAQSLDDNNVVSSAQQQQQGQNVEENKQNESEQTAVPNQEQQQQQEQQQEQEQQQKKNNLFGDPEPQQQNEDQQRVSQQQEQMLNNDAL